jgi:hypothetical protein
MQVGQARAAAAAWVAEHAHTDGFRGAYISGSTIGLPDTAELSPYSDLDLTVLTAQADPPPSPGKLRYQGTLLEVSVKPWAGLASAEAVLASYHLAGSFRTDSVIADPTGRLRGIQSVVAREFARRPWVRRRYEDALALIGSRLTALAASPLDEPPSAEQFTTWLFAAGVTAHVPLVAALRNPTVRLRYQAARDVLVAAGRDELYGELLGLLGCAELDAARVRRHLREMAATFDATVPVTRTRFFFSGDLSVLARPVAVDGSADLIERGLHREAVFWIAATFARCHMVLAVDAPRLHRARLPAFRALLADLGVVSGPDLLRRGQEVGLFLPRLRRAAEEMVAADPAIGG